MGSLSQHITINIAKGTVGLKRNGYGTMLIASANASFPERARIYTDLSGMVDDGFAETSPEWRAAAAAWSQRPKMPRIMIGRLANKPTLVYTIAVSQTLNSHTYQLEVSGPGMADTTVSYTSDANATSAEIAAGLVAALNAVTGNNFIAAGATSPFTVTADAPGGWFSLGLVNDGSAPNDLEIAMTHADAGIAADLTAIKLAAPSWYALHTIYNSKATVLAAAAWTEANEVLYGVAVNDTDAITTTVGNADTLDALKSQNYDRTHGWYHPTPGEFLDAAIMGRCLPLDPGAETWKWKNLNAVTTVALTATHAANLRARNANTYEELAGRGATWEGTAASGEFIDYTRSVDWLKDDMQKSIAEVLMAADKISYDEGGIELIANPMRASLARAVRKKVLAANPPPEVEKPNLDDISESDRANRILPDMKWSGRGAGAIHNVDVDGTISL